MSILLTLWRLLDHRQRRQIVGLQLLSIVMALSTVGGIAAVLPFFAVLADPHAIEHNALLRAVLRGVHLDSDGSSSVVLGTAFAAVVLLANAVNLFGFMAINQFAARVGDTLYVRLFDEYIHRDYEFHIRSKSSVLAGKVQESARVTSTVLQQALILVTNLVTIMCVAIAVVLVNPVVAVTAIVGLGASYAAIYATARRRLLRNGRFMSRHHAEQAQTVNEGLGAIRDVMLAQARELFVRRFADQSRAISRAAVNTLAISQAPKYVLECITVACLVGVALYLHARAGASGPWMAQLSFVVFAAYRLLPALQQAFSAIVRIRVDRAAFAGIEMDLGRVNPSRRIKRDALMEGTWRGRPSREIRLCEVSFRYAHDRSAAVLGASLVIPAGAIVGFIGPNGCGKTTLLDLVSGLLVPQSGHVEVDGIRLDHENCIAWQSTIAYVPQQVSVFEATLAQNIAFGTPPAQIDLERLESAVRSAQLAECVAALPNGYDEWLGAGCALSGGQRQRLAIARALYRNASLLILDEATSALDTAAEGDITEMLHRLRPNRTILIIAHRSAALRHCDFVVELNHGRITRSGLYEQLSPTNTLAENLC
jgi:ABC-type multidrug transport system fused ATPase/permease subunit